MSFRYVCAKIFIFIEKASNKVSKRLINFSSIQSTLRKTLPFAPLSALFLWEAGEAC
jgi:hypothetical protein